MANIIVFGASRGLGAAFSKGLPESGDKVWVVSRSEPSYINHQHQWIKADLSNSLEAVKTIKDVIHNEVVDTVIYNAGIWESEPFEQISQEQLIKIVNVNLTSLILGVQALIPNIKASQKGRIFLISSTCGLENEGSSTVGYVSTKFGVRGAAHALREYFRNYKVTVTCISPGSMATDIPFEDGEDKAISVHKGQRIPVTDVVGLVKAIIKMSSASCPKEIDLPATPDTDA